nr:uncharacterized protein LOC109762617 [Aegilops tauschii subsp. strangulata]
MALREVARTGARYTWTNKQLPPVRSVLNRVFGTAEWELWFPMCSLVAETQIGSDHVPLVLSTGEDRLKRGPRFFFETAWFEIPEFYQVFRQKWDACINRLGPQRGPMGLWVTSGAGLRVSLKGWGANQGREDKLRRAHLVQELAAMDAQADAHPFSEQEWAHRYDLEGQVEALLRAEEEYWRRRGGLKWTLKGDANMKYFHAYANGRRRKCAILRLQSEQGLLLRQGDIMQHVYQFYIQLMGTCEPPLARLRTDLWGPSGRVSEAENEELCLAFTPREIDAAVHGMKSDTAPGPDGWPVAMFKRFWSLLQGQIFGVCNGFMRGEVDTSRLNFGILSLIPKVQGAENIRQVLLGRGFSPVWVHCMLQLVSGGQMEIAINGEVGHYFRNKRGLRQGDPASPLLFNFVADALAAMLDRARTAGHLRGFANHLVPGGVSNLQYADDMLLLFEPDRHSIATVKAILLSFELMPGLKINFHKCEVISMGMGPDES